MQSNTEHTTTSIHGTDPNSCPPDSKHSGGKDTLQAAFYHGYKVYENGKVENSVGKEIFPLNNGKMKIFVNGKKRTLSHARIIYEAFSNQTILRSEVITYKDGDPTNICFQNIVIRQRKEYFANAAWNENKRIITAEQEKMILEDRKKPFVRIKNGKKRKLSRTPYTALAERYGCSTTTIYKILKKHNVTET